MTNLRLVVPFALLAMTLLSGCPWARWVEAHQHHGHDKPVACELSSDCDDGLPETFDFCADSGFCDTRMAAYDADIQPIFQAKCAGCHVDSGTGTCSGNACLASSYAALEMDSNVCAGLSVAECAQIRIHDGSMPRGRGCTGDPEMDMANGSCLTAEEQGLLDAWIAAGWPESVP